MIAHWDEVEEHGSTFVALGPAIGSRKITVNLLKLPPGGRSGASGTTCESILHVLRGSGRHGDDELGPGDTVVHLAGTAPRELRAGSDGLDALLFFELVPREAAAEGAGRAGTVLALADAPVILGGAVRILGDAAGSVHTGLNTFTHLPGGPEYVPHAHSLEEEIFVVLEGSGEFHAGEETWPVRAGHVISCLPGTGVPHAFTAGPDRMTHLAYGTRDPDDVPYYPSETD